MAKIYVANAHVVLEAAWCKQQHAIAEKKMKKHVYQETVELTTVTVLKAFWKWVANGEHMDTDNDWQPLVSKKAIVDIVKVLFPKIAPQLKIKE